MEVSASSVANTSDLIVSAHVLNRFCHTIVVGRDG